jgi:high affinity sulfate transporter 1
MAAMRADTAIASVARYVPILRWLPAYDRADLRFDLIAAVVGWGVMVPVAMAYAGLAGVPPELGLVTAFTALAAYAVFGTSRHLKVTASSSIAVMSASVIGAIAAAQDPATYVALSAALALAVGAILVVAGAARLGFLSQFLAASVVTGFVIGLAFVITVGQIPALIGIPPVSGTIIEKLVAIAGTLDDVDPYTAVLGVGTLIGIVVLKRIVPKLPGPLIALVIGIALSTALDLSAKGVAVVGDVATGIPLPRFTAIPVGDIIFIVTGAFGIVFLALAESIGAARAFGTKHGYDIDPNQELIALGASNLASGLFGGFAVDASLSQSATGEAAGTRTQASTLITAGLILATSIVLAPLFANLPLSVLAAIVIAATISLVNFGELRRYWAWKRTDFLLAMTALGGVVFTTALTGMAIAVALSLLAILYQASRPYIAILGRIPGDPPVFADAGRHSAAEPIAGFLLLRPNVPLTFVNADVAKDQIMGLIAARPEPPRAVVVDIGATADLDVATMDMMAALLVELGVLGVELRLSQVRGSVRDRMRRSGLMASVGEDHCFLSDEAAVAAPLPERPERSGAEAQTSG